MRKAAVAAGVVLVATLAAAFASLNRRQIVTVDLGFWTFYRVPLTFVLFAGIVLGMGAMLLAGIHADLRVRRILRERLAEEDREERERMYDRHQRDLFQEEEA